MVKHEFKHLLVKIKYDDCTNYEGVKILLYLDTEMVDLLKQKQIDPHFSDNPEYISPTVRLEPTDRGWKMGLEILENIA